MSSAGTGGQPPSGNSHYPNDRYPRYAAVTLCGAWEKELYMPVRWLMSVALLLASGPAAAEERPVARHIPFVEEDPIKLDLSGRPAARQSEVPRARWEYRRDGPLWSRVALSAVETHGAALLDVVPRDIADWCPAYPENSSEDRAAFWVALLSTLARYESTWNPSAVGGGGRWFGLMQIYPPTAEFRDCRVQSGEALKDGPNNLNCAVRIMAITVPRDQAISLQENRWKGVAADWGPIRTPWMRRDMQRYTKRQIFCRPLSEVRPKERPLN